jgi:hypothetical protein
MKENVGLTVALKVKRFIRVLRRPFIKTKLDFSAQLYHNENESVPAASVGGDYDTDIKLVDIIAVLAAVSCVFSFFKAIRDLFS